MAVKLNIAKKSLGVQATDAVREAILCGRFKAGQRLTEASLAEELDLARVTIRSALQQLAAEGLVVQRPYRGCEVRKLSSQDIWELYTLRGALEALAARLAAQCMQSGKASSENLDRALHKLEKFCHSSEADLISQVDFALHKSVIDLSGHGLLKNQYQLIEQQVRLCIASSNALITNADEILKQHKPLVLAIKNGDADAAAEIAMNHNIAEGEVLRQYALTQEAKQSA